jgi:hypothetical protein
MPIIHKGFIMFHARAAICLLALSTSSVYAEITPINHEVSIGFSDVRDADDNFIGASYRYYFDTVNIGEQAYAISPYLQRSNNVSVDYFGIDNVDQFNITGEWFSQDDLVVRGRYGRTTDDNRFYDATLQRFGVDVSKFVTANWEVGAGVDFYDLDETFRAFDGGSDVQRFGDSEFSASVFARYTSFGFNPSSFKPGWDIKLKGTHFDDELTLEIDADYYFQPNWSVGVMAIHENNDRFGSENVVELGTNYWFNAHSSLRFGAGVDTDEGRLGSLTLLGTFRF